jgi:hypothetical protein
LGWSIGLPQPLSWKWCCEFAVVNFVTCCFN